MATNSGIAVGQNLGFIGVGTMNSAIIEGILKVYNSESFSNHFAVPIYISLRGKLNVEALKAKHGDDLIKVCENNQDILRKADIIFLGVRPEQVVQVLENRNNREESDDQSNPYLKFDARRHCIVNLISTLTNAVLLDMINNKGLAGNESISNDQVIKAVPLPGVQFLSGTTVISPPNMMEGKICNLFEQLGTTIEVEEEHLPYFLSISSMMGPFYQQCQILQQWMFEKIRAMKNKRPTDAANTNEEMEQKRKLQKYLIGFFDTILSDAKNSGDTWQELMNAQTKGGLNEQAMQLMDGTKEVTHCTLDTILGRITNSLDK